MVYRQRRTRFAWRISARARRSRGIGKLSTGPGVRHARLTSRDHVDHYHPDGGWHDLRFAAADAREMADTLSSQGGFEVVGLLKGKVRSQELLEAFDRLNAASRDSSDVVVVYISSHGTLARGPHGELRRGRLREAHYRDLRRHRQRPRRRDR